MEDYKEMYLKLFRKVTETIETLQIVQQQVEELYMAQEEGKLVLLDYPCETQGELYEQINKPEKMQPSNID